MLNIENAPLHRTKPYSIQFSTNAKSIKIGYTTHNRFYFIVIVGDRITKIC